MKILSLQKLKTKPKITGHIHWEWTPQMIEESRKKDKGLTMEEILEFKKQSEERQGYSIVHEYGQMHTNREDLEKAKVTIQALGEDLRAQGKI